MKQSPEPFVRWTNEQTRFTHIFLDGDLEAAESAAAVAFELGVATAQPDTLLGYAGQLFQLRRAQDRLDEVAEQLEQFAAENPELKIFRAGLAYMYCELSRTAEASELARELDLSRGLAPSFWSTTLMLWAEVCHTLGLSEPASRLVPILDGWKGQVASTGATTEGSIAYGLGLALATVGRNEEAAQAYDIALDMNTRLRAPLFIARTRVAQAELVAATQPGRSHEIVTEVRAAIVDFGFARIERRIDGLLKRFA